MAKTTLWFPAFWGTWGKPEYCPGGTFAIAFRNRIEGKNHDNSALNDIELRCKNEMTISSKRGYWGYFQEWSTKCDTGFSGAKVTIQDQMVNTTGRLLETIYA